MGITLEQYRASIGMHNAIKFKSCQTLTKNIQGNFLLPWFDFLLGFNPTKILPTFCYLFIFINFIFDILHDCVKCNTFYVKHDPFDS